MLKGKVVLITGSSRGIGACTAGLLAENGASVIVNYRKDKKNAEKVVSGILKKGSGSAISVKADVTRAPEVNAMVEEIVRRFGRIDAVINNASCPMTYVSLEKLCWNDFDRYLEANLRGAFNTIKSVLPSMVRRRKGKIINILSSVTLGVPPAKPVDYISAKYALLGLSKSLASELGPSGITVNCVSPGMTETDMTRGIPDKMKELVAYQTPMRRLAEPADTARVLLFLCSDLSDYITGANIPVCGGSTMQ